MTLPKTKGSVDLIIAECDASVTIDTCMSTLLFWHAVMIRRRYEFDDQMSGSNCFSRFLGEFCLEISANAPQTRVE